MKKIKTIFIGTSNFAVPVLEALLDFDFLDIVCVVTQPDRPVGRKQVLTPPPIKQMLLARGTLRQAQGDISSVADIVIEQPEKIRRVGKELMEKYQPELILVASYGQIIPNSILNYPKYKCLNLHVSLLPHLRGAVPMPMAILEGLEETGTTLQIMSKGMDEGDIISTRKIKLDDSETAESLEKKSAKASIELLKEDLPKWISGEIKAVPQNHDEATYCYIADLKKEKAEITFDTDVQLAERMTRAFYPWPVAWITISTGAHSGKRLKIFGVESVKLKDESGKNEELRMKNEEGNLILCLKNGDLNLKEVQLEGKKRDLASNYLYLA